MKGKEKRKEKKRCNKGKAGNGGKMKKEEI